MSDRFDYREHHRRKCRRDCPKKILLICGNSVSSGVTTHKRGDRIRLASVFVDTSCVCRPIVKIEFSNNIRFETDFDDKCKKEEAQIRIRYDLFRKCKREFTPQLLDTWIFEREIESEKGKIELTTTDTVSFHFCSNNEAHFDERCEYFVVATTEEAENAKATFLKSAISAFVQDDFEEDEKEEKEHHHRREEEEHRRRKEREHCRREEEERCRREEEEHRRRKEREHYRREEEERCRREEEYRRRKEREHHRREEEERCRREEEEHRRRKEREHRRKEGRRERKRNHIDDFYWEFDFNI
ncbi:hypothetical protein CLPU_8c00050 [Gottschalkia purinilytica]|uniref:Uncharacterized protein n=1 Tax=Gottschalkia purinilytica TaxID=1503 RepID=A0A0L0WAA2_GOTPU|nr:DUF4489 domain-containing protein [Gottschalkia purinilytica]KNF08240.1 hypothetical protein CLPU_8c00050 [Gottschalkia purinilytica]